MAKGVLWATTALLLLCVPAAGLLVNHSEWVVSCYKAKNTNFSAPSLCSHVSWGSANLYPRSTYSHYNYGQALTSSNQSKIAEEAFTSLRKQATSLSSDCDAALTWFTCADAFPYCPAGGVSSSGIGYLPVCKIHCLQAKSLCGLDELDCDDYRGGNCMTYLPNGYFLIPPDQGPLDSLPDLYLVAIGFWAFCLVVWVVLNLVYFGVKARPPPVSAMGAIYSIRLISCCVAYNYWTQCSAYLGMCTFDLTYATLAGMQATEAVQYMILIYVARNLAIVTKHTVQEISAAWFLDCVFFVISFALRSVILRAPTTYWIVMISLLYFFVFYTLVSVSSHEWRRMKAQLERMTNSMPAHVTQQVAYKTRLHEQLFHIAALMLFIEITSQCMLALNVKAQTLLGFYEGTQIVLLGYFGFLMRPRRWSPFFFMEPSVEPTAQLNMENRALAVVRVDGVLASLRSAGESEAPPELELAPLLYARDRADPPFVSVLMQPDGKLQVGM